MLPEEQLHHLTAELYDNTIDFINLQLYELLYDNGYITELNDEALDLMNAILDRYFSLEKNPFSKQT